MRKLFVGVAVAASALIAAVAPGGAVTYGQPDGDDHPYVGLIIYWVPAEESWFSCTGTLLDADTFLTAAHCTFGIGTDGEALGSSGGTDVWATFGEADVLEGFPPRDSFDTPEELYEGRRAWLEAQTDFFQGTAYADPAYDDFASFPENHDVGIVELSETGHGVTSFGALAPQGTAEALAGPSGKGRNAAVVETVGYGVQSVQPNPQDDETRYRSTSRIVEVNGNQSRGGNIHTSNNPSTQGGRGGSCFGDSGGPVLALGTNQVVAVVSYGPSATCHGADYAWRVDTVEAYQFVTPFLSQ